MKRQGFHYRVLAEILLSVDELNHLIEQASNHYDPKCRNTALIGGFLYGFRNRMVWAQQSEGATSLEFEMSSDRLDLVCKILEQPGSRRDLFESFHQTLREVHAEWRRLNPVPNVF